MSYATEYIAAMLKKARIAKGLSQRELSKLAEVHQSHISKIEKGAVDLRLSTLVTIARALDLELTLVPRKNISAVASLVRSTSDQAKMGSRNALKELKRLNMSILRASQENPAIKELAQLNRQVRDLSHFQLPQAGISALKDANKIVEAFTNSQSSLEAIRKTLSDIQSFRNLLAHGTALTEIENVRPAYSLEEDDHG